MIKKFIDKLLGKPAAKAKPKSVLAAGFASSTWFTAGGGSMR